MLKVLRCVQLFFVLHSRADTGMQTKKMEATNTDPAEVTAKVTQSPSQVLLSDYF